MPSLLIRDVDDHLKRRLRERAVQHGWSMEEEVRTILRREVMDLRSGKELVDLATELFGPDRGVDLVIPRMPEREPPDFSE